MVNEYFEHLKKKGYKRLTDTLFETSDGYIFQYVEKTEVFYGKPRTSKYLIMIGKDKKIDNKWCNRDCQFLSKRQDDVDTDVSCYCMLRNMDRYVGLAEDVDSNACYCVSDGILIPLN